MPPSRHGNVNTESVDNYLKAILALSGLKNTVYRVHPWLTVWVLRPLRSPICCKSWHRLRCRLWNTKDTAEFCCQRRANGGLLKCCAIIVSSKPFSTKSSTTLSKRFTKKRSALNISSRSGSRSGSMQSWATQSSIRMAIAFRRWTEKCRNSLPSRWLIFMSKGHSSWTAFQMRMRLC